MSTTAFGVVVPNYNGAQVLPRCLASLRSQRRPPDEILVVDNGSSDGSADAAERDFPEVRVLRQSRNTGFGAAANLGVRAATAPLVAVLNSDARPTADWVESLCSFDEPGAWAWGGVLTAPDGLVESAGDCYSLHGHSFKALQGSSVHELPAEPYQVFAVPGAAVVVRREVFLALGGYDERFFLYYEDIDLAFRARAAGYTAWVLPQVRVEHDLAGSGTWRGATHYIARNAVACYVRNVPELHPRILWRTTVREFGLARRGGRGAPYARGCLAALPRLPRALVDRRSMLRDRRVPASALEAMCELRPPSSTTRNPG